MVVAVVAVVRTWGRGMDITGQIVQAHTRAAARRLRACDGARVQRTLHRAARRKAPIGVQPRPPPPHASPPGCNLAAPDSYFDTNDAAAAKAFAAANATMYGNADAVIVGFSAAGPKDVLFT